MRGFALSGLALVAAAGSAAFGQGTITDTGTNYSVGININGNLYNPSDGVGFRRLSDGYDPISPGTPTESWGAAIVGGDSGYADPMFAGTVNVGNISAVFGANTAQTSSMVGTTLRVDHDFSFANANVIRIRTKLTNLSANTETLRYKRLCDWDILPSIFSEFARVDPLASNVVDSSYHPFGAEARDAITPMVAPGPGLFGAGDLGGGLTVQFAGVPSGGFVEFDIFHAISNLGQVEAGLRGQLLVLGAEFIVTGISNPPGTVPEYTAAIGYATVLIPTPGALALLGLGGMVAARRRRA